MVDTKNSQLCNRRKLFFLMLRYSQLTLRTLPQQGSGNVAKNPFLQLFCVPQWLRYKKKSGFIKFKCIRQWQFTKTEGGKKQKAVNARRDGTGMPDSVEILRAHNPGHVLLHPLVEQVTVAPRLAEILRVTDGVPWRAHLHVRSVLCDTPSGFWAGCACARVHVSE